MTYWNRFVVLGLVAVTAAITFKASSVEARPCDGCGKNSATVVDGVVFDELNVDPNWAGAGPRIDSVAFENEPTKPVILSVEGDELVAHVDGRERRTYELAGLVITLSSEVAQPGPSPAGTRRRFQLRIARFYDRLSFWASPDGPVPAYEVEVRKLTSENQEGFVRLCTGKYVEPTVTTEAGQEFTALVFAGDQYDDKHVVTIGPVNVTTRDVTARDVMSGDVTDAEKRSFNLACFGSASAKMHLLRHTSAGTPPGTDATTPEQRTAMLRAITADYCGDGNAWTGEGTPLWWTDRGRLFPLERQPGYESQWFPDRIEAIWGLGGTLLCLNEPRRSPGPDAPTANCSQPAVPRPVVETVCGNGTVIPSCHCFSWPEQRDTPWDAPPLLPNDEAPSNDLSTAYVITVNRPESVDYCNLNPAGVISWQP